MKRSGFGWGVLALALSAATGRATGSAWREATDKLGAGGFERFLDLYAREGWNLHDAFDLASVECTRDGVGSVKADGDERAALSRQPKPYMPLESDYHLVDGRKAALDALPAAASR